MKLRQGFDTPSVRVTVQPDLLFRAGHHRSSKTQQALSGTLYVIEGVAEIGQLQHQEDTVQQQLGVAANNKQAVRIKREDFVQYKRDAPTNLAESQVAKETLLVDLRRQIAAVNDAMEAETKLNDRYTKHRPSKLSSCSSLTSILAVVGSCLMYRFEIFGVKLKGESPIAAHVAVLDIPICHCCHL